MDSSNPSMGFGERPDREALPKAWLCLQRTTALDIGNLLAAVLAYKSRN